ncbi:hypothetical protein LINPERHAP1_LOCUS20798 [Linum perenne]
MPPSSVMQLRNLQSCMDL